MSALFRDVRYALLSMRRTPWFTSAALATLALGIGATTLIFTVVDGLLVRPLPFRDADRLVRVWEEHPGGSTANGNRWLSHRTFEAWTASPRTIDAIGGYADYEFTVRLGDEPERMMGADLTPGIFVLLHETPALGRFFTAEEATSQTKVVVISDRLWRERFGGAPDVLGRTLTIVDDTYRIVGVARPEWRFPNRRVQFWRPYAIPTVAAEPRRTVTFTALGRLASGATPAQAEAEGTAAARSMPRPMSADLMFGKGGPVVVHARPFAADIAAPMRPAAIVMAAVVACLLLMACANVANLLLSRGVARQRELAVRFAVGGSTGRIVQQLLTEALVLSAIGGVIGVLIASWLLDLLPAVAPARLPRVEDMQLDGRVLLFASAATLLCAIVAGLAPALRGARVDLSQAFRGGDGSSAGGFRGPGARRTRTLLLIAESAIAVMLLVAASLLAHSFARLAAVDAGYSADRVLTARIRLPLTGTGQLGPGLARTAQVIDSVRQRLEATPGVVAVGAANMMPMWPNAAITTFAVRGTLGEPGAVAARARTYFATPGYAEALQLRLREGRLFSSDDVRAGTRAMLVNEAFAREYLADGPVVGRQIPNVLSKNTTNEVVGVVANVLKDGNDQVAEPEVYLPNGWPGAPEQGIFGTVNLVVRTSGDPAALAPMIRQFVRDADATTLVEGIAPLSTMVHASMAQPRFTAGSIVAFASIALVLAAVGLFGVLSYTVAERRRELGIRAALGAHRRSLIALVLREGLAVTLVGIGMGLAGAAALTRFMQGVLFGVTPLDPVSFVAAPLLLVPVAIVACLGPALRAASADPIVTLRSS